MKVTIDGIEKKFGETTAVNKLSLTVEDGSLVALLGPSGCGKSTILNMLSGILPVTSGKIYFENEDVTDLPPEKRGVGLVFQNYALYPHMTVLENICFPLSIKGIPKKERLKIAKQYAEMVHIEELLKRKPAELSGGQQQRVAIARALAKQPRLLLLDEPLSNLDAKLRVEMREEIRRIQRQSGVTTIFVTHDQEEASSISDKVLLLNKGVLQQYDKVRELYDNPNNLFVADFLGSPTINKVNGVMTKNGFLADGYSEAIDFGADANILAKTRVVLALRPESLVINGEHAKFEAILEETYMSGKDELVLLSYGDKKIRAYIEGNRSVEIASTVKVGFKSYGIFIFDELTGERYL